MVTTSPSFTRKAGRQHDALEDAAADRDVAGERALLVHVLAVDGALGGLEAQAHLLVEAGALLLAGELLAGKEHALLLLVGLLSLHSSTTATTPVSSPVLPVYRANNRARREEKKNETISLFCYCNCCGPSARTASLSTRSKG